MKKLLIIIVILIIVAGAGYFLWQKYAGGTPIFERKVTAENYKEKFMWGATMRPNAFGRYIAQLWIKQIDVAKNLGLNFTRIPWSWAPDEFKFNDEIVKYLQDNGLNVYMIIEPKGDFNAIQNTYQDGYDTGYKIASHYAGKIKYYQVLNESGSWALKGPEYSGENESDYDETKYQRTRDWIKGAADGIKKADPKAYRAVTSQWLQTGFYSRLQKDNVDYDLIGWDWFSDMGFIGEKKLTDGTLLIDKLKTFDKPLFIAEINYRPEGKNGVKGQPEAKQADYIQKSADWAVENKLVGYYVLELMDTRDPNTGFVDHYGIYTITKSASGTWVPDKPRQAYTVFQEIIKKYSK